MPLKASGRKTWSLLPQGAAPEAGILVAARGVRAFGDGFVAVLLPVYLTSLGLSALDVGAVTTATLLGSAALTLLIGFVAYRLRRRSLLVCAGCLMAATGVGFALVRSFWPLLVVAFLGTLNPSAGDVSVFLPLEQSLLPQTVDARSRTALYARYSLVAAVCGAVGSLAAGLPTLAAGRTNLGLGPAVQLMFLLYGAIGLAALALYRRLPPAIGSLGKHVDAPLGPSKGIVYRLAALFSLDAFGGGFFVQSLLALWLFGRFHLGLAEAGTIFFWAGLFSAISFLAAPSLAARFGLVNTMVFSHLPANIFLMLVPVMPNLPLALVFLFLRSALSQMDVPTRTSYIMSVVTPEERPAAASVTSVPRSLASSASPLLAGYLLGLSTFGWPLVIGGALKVAYDLLLLSMFAKVRPPEEA